MRKKNSKRYTICLIFLSLTFIGTNPLPGQTILVDSGAEWKYIDDGSDRGTLWRNPFFDDAEWSIGTAQFGYGDGDEATVISYGSDPENKYITYYFRHSFYVSDPSQFLDLTLELLRDDGAVVYLNGIEIERSNMPVDTINYLTLATSSAGGDENIFFESTEDPINLVAGTNVLAVEVHQDSLTGSDVSFDLKLFSLTQFPDVTHKAPYLIYNGNNTEMQVLWQLYSSHTSTIEWGTDTQYSLGSVQTNEYGDDHQHTYTISNLSPDVKYYYRVNVNHEFYTGSFRSAPDSTTKSIKFFVYGDTRSNPTIHNDVAADIVATYVEDENFQSFILSAGDLVSDGNSESNWDDQFFDPLYPNLQNMLTTLPYQSCMGNHENEGVLFTKYFPYPFVAGHYWSFDYGLAHFVIVDQYTSYNPGSAQLTWIENDLAFRSKAWNFIILHEPGWSAGSHGNESDVQNYIQPLCEQYNVHVVFGGHNHNYARAFVNNVHHITTGGGGAPLYDPDPGYPNIVASAKAHHFCKVEIDGKYLTITVVDTSGNIIDLFSIEDQSLPIGLLAVPADTLNFEDVLIGLRDTLEINIINTGYDVLHLTDVRIAEEGFMAINDTLNIEIGESQLIAVIFEPLTEQTYFGSLSFSSNDPNNPAVVINLKGEGVLPPDITVTPDTLIENLVIGDITHQVLTISNQGSRDLVFNISISPIFSWLLIDTLSGIIPSHSATDLSVAFDATELTDGNYNSNIIILSNDPNKPELNIPVHLTVAGLPDISLSDTLLSFEDTYVGLSLIDTLVVSNVGINLLTITDVSSNNPDFSTDTSSFNILPGERFQLLVTFTPDTLGLSLATLTISSNDPDEQDFMVSLRGEVVLPPDITVTPDTLIENLVIGDITHQVLTISNQGSRDLVFNISISPIFSWLLIDTLSGIIPSHSATDLSVAFDATELTNGNYNSNFIILSNDPNKPELNIPVHLTVAGLPDISLSDTLLSFEDTYVGLSLIDTLVVSNVGINLLTITDVSSNNPDFSTDTSFFNILPGERFQLLVTFTPDTLGLSLATLTISSNDPDEQDLMVSLRGEALIPPNIIVSPSSWSDSLEVGQNMTGTITIRNTGGSFLNINISYDSSGYALKLPNDAKRVHSTLQSWLTVSPDSGKISAGDSLDIEIRVTAAGLSSGEFEAKILISCNDPNNKEIIIPVYIKVTPTGIEDLLSAMIPDTYELYQNYPNPFNPTTHIRYGLPKPGDVRIEIYNTIGQLINTLLDKPMPAGYHQVEFHSQDLPSGIYFYRIEAGEFQDVKKMILIK